MKDRKLASRYARALLASISDTRIAEQVDQFLDAIRRAVDESEELRGILIDPAVPRNVRTSVLRKLADENSMPKQVGNFFETVVDHHRSSSLASIAQVFHEELEEQMGIVPAEITTAWPLSDEMKERALKALEKMTGRKVRLNHNLEPGILGGAVTRIGSTVYDGSLRTQLAQLRQKMIQE